MFYRWGNLRGQPSSLRDLGRESSRISYYSAAYLGRMGTECALEQVLVVADRKTPADWAWEGVKVLTVEEQERLNYRTARLTPWNSYA